MFFDSAKLVHSATLSSNKIATANASHFVYTTLAEQTIARITKLHLIMETTFYMFGEEYLRWTNEKGETFEAVKEQVEFFGKECFEQNPEDCPEGEYTEENPYKYIDDWKEEHPNQSAVPFPEWI